MAFRNIRLFLGITLLCVGGVLVFYQVIEHLWLRPIAVVSPVSPAEKSGPGAGNGSSSHGYRIILERNLFGTGPGRSETEENQNDLLTDLALASPDMLLMGTIAGDRKDKRAIIMDTGTSKQRLFHIGDSIKGAVIKDIGWEKVVLHYPERDEILDMAETRRYFSERTTGPSSRHQQRGTPAAGIRDDRPIAPVTRIMPPTRRFSLPAGGRASER